MRKLLLLCSFGCVVAQPCSEGSSPSCPLPAGAAPWQNNAYYNSFISASACKSNSSSCAAMFYGFYAKGLTCSTVPELVPSSGFITAACFAFIAGVLSMALPFAPCSCVGRHTPYLTAFGSLALHVTLFSLSIDYLLSETRGTSSDARACVYWCWRGLLTANGAGHTPRSL